MYLKLFHGIRRIWKKFGARIRALVIYLSDYPTAAVCILYLLLQHPTILLSRTVAIGWGILLLLLLLVLLIFLLWVFLKNEIFLLSFLVENKWKRLDKILTLSFMPFLIILLQLIRISPIITTEREIEENSGGFTSSSTTVTAFLSDEIEGRYDSNSGVFSILEASNSYGYKIKTSRVKIAVKIPKFKKISVGQVCKLDGEVVEPKNSQEFNYKEFLKNRGIFFLMDFPTINCRNISEERRGFFLKNILIDLKGKIVRQIEKILSEPQTSLLIGILFGSDRLFSKNFESNLRIAGVSHIISASGYNITVLSILLDRMFSFLSRKRRIIFVLVIIWCFAILSGLSPSIIRACIMATISNIAIMFGRVNSSHISLLLTAVVFLILNPLTIYNVGFQLSISAMIGLLYISPILEKLLPKKEIFQDIVNPTISCTLSTLPVSLLTFKTVSIWSLFANILLLPVISSTMMFGIIALLLQPVLSPLSYFFFNIVNIQLKYFEKVVNIIGGSGIGTVSLSQQSAGIVTITVIISIFILTIYFYPLENEKRNYYIKEKYY